MYVFQQSTNLRSGLFAQGLLRIFSVQVWTPRASGTEKRRTLWEGNPENFLDQASSNAPSSVSDLTLGEAASHRLWWQFQTVPRSKYFQGKLKKPFNEDSLLTLISAALE